MSTETKEYVLILKVNSAVVYTNTSVSNNVILKKAHITIAYLEHKTDDELKVTIDGINDLISGNEGEFPRFAYVTGPDNFGKNKDTPVYRCSIEGDENLLNIWKKFNIEQEATKGLKAPNYHVTIKPEHPKMKTGDKYITGDIFVKEVGGIEVLGWGL
jgi:hypothetical protein